MVNRIGILGFFSVASCYAFESLLPKDPTTTWCHKASYSGIGLPDWYQCYSNPLGVDRMVYWWRLPDSNQVNNCLLLDESLRFPYGDLLRSTTWYEFSAGILIWGGPLVPRLTLDLDEDCVRRSRGYGGVFNLKPGDSIRLEFKMTPWDTAVTDTIRGEIKAYLRDSMPTIRARRHRITRGPAASWNHGSILLSRPEVGPFELIDLRGHTLTTRAQTDGQRTRVVPSTTLSPGLYHLRWPEGSASLVVPR